MQSYKNIRTMTKLAVYDKKHGKKDREITSHYRHSYVYKKSIGARLGVLLGIAILIGLNYLYSMMMYEDKFFSMLTTDYFISLAVKVAVVMIIYTIICAFKYRKEYDDAQERLDDYEQRFEVFCRQEESAERNAYE